MGLIKMIKDELNWSSRVIEEAGQQGIDWWESIYGPNDDPTPADIRAMRRLLTSAKGDAEAISDYFAAKRYEEVMSKIDEVTDDDGNIKRKRFLGLF